MDALQRLKELAEELPGLETQIVEVAKAKQSELQTLVDGIEARGRELVTLEESIKQAQSTQVAAAQATSKQKDKLNGELAEVNAELATAKRELAATVKKNNQFMQYQVTAKKALESRETSLLERERVMEETLASVRRRGGILAELS